jgi:hypothetical protein
MLTAVTASAMNLPINLSSTPTQISFAMVGGPKDTSTHEAQLGPIAALISLYINPFGAITSSTYKSCHLPLLPICYAMFITI